MKKNYLATISIFSLASILSTLGFSSIANAWGGPHSSVHTEYYHTATHGTYVTSTPHYLHKNADPDCPYYEATQTQTPTETETQMQSNTQSQVSTQTRGQAEDFTASYNGRGYGRRHGNGSGHHYNSYNAHGGHHYANREDCPYYSE